jgi:hypothetical protein
VVNQRTEIKRGRGWETEQWQRFEPRFVGMADVANNGLEELGVTLTKGVVLTVQRVANRRKLKTQGWSIDNKNHLAVQVPADAAYPTPKQYALWSGVMVHEDIHSARAETVSYYGELLEGIVTEGMAYDGELDYIMCKAIQSARDDVANLGYLPTAEELERFHDIPCKSGKLASQPWLSKQVGGVPVMARLGVHFVRERQAEGATKAELLKMPAPEVIGL